jgi:hypothetical protein
MRSLTRRSGGRSSTPALVLAALAVAALVGLVVRGLGRARRRARRRELLAAPPQEPAWEAAEPPGVAYPDEALVEELRERPRPVGTDEAAQILGLGSEALASLNIPVTRAPDGRVVYDSWEIVHWVDVRRTDPAGFEARIGGR